MPLGTKASFSALAAAYHSAAAASSSSSSSTTTAATTPSTSTVPTNAPQHAGPSAPAAPLSLHAAAASGNLAVARSLLKSHASEPTILAAALAQPLHGVLPLHAAASGGNEHIVALLLSYGADPNALLYREPVFVPAYQPRNASIDIPRGSTPSFSLPSPPPQPGGPGEEGSTALHFAAAAGHRDVIATLLQNGAKPDARDLRGITPEMLASASGHNLCAEILRKAAAGPAIVPRQPPAPSAVSGGSSTSSAQSGAVPPPLAGTLATSNGGSASSSRRERTTSNLVRKPPPLDIKDAPAPPPITTPTRSLKNQASLEHIAAGMKATFSGWNRTYSNANNPFNSGGSGSAQPGSATKLLSKHSSNPNLRSGAALLAESSVGESLPGSKPGEATRKSSKDRVKERLKEPIRSKDKSKTATPRHNSSSPLVVNASQAGPSREGLIGDQADEAQAGSAVFSDDLSDGSESDLGFSAATTPPAPPMQGQTFIASTSEAVPPLPGSDVQANAGATDEAGSTRRRPSLPFLASNPAQAVRAALSGSGTGTGQSSVMSPIDVNSSTSAGKSKDRVRDPGPAASYTSGLAQSPRGGSMLSLTPSRRSEPGSGSGVSATMPPSLTSGTGQYAGAGLEKGSAAPERRGGEAIEELASPPLVQHDVFNIQASQQLMGVVAGSMPTMQRSTSSSTTASTRSDAASRLGQGQGVASSTGLPTPEMPNGQPIGAGLIRSAAAGVSAASSPPAGSPRMQALLLQASAGSGSSGGGGSVGPPSSPNRLAQRVTGKRSIPNMLRKLGSQSHLAAQQQQSQAGLSASSMVVNQAGTVSTGAPSSSSSNGIVAGHQYQPTPLRTRTPSKSRDRADDLERERERSRTMSAATSTLGIMSSPMESQRSSHSIDVAREAEDEVRELRGEDNLGRNVGLHRASSQGASGGASANGVSAGTGSAPFPSSASNGSAGSSSSSPRVPNFVNLVGLPQGAMTTTFSSDRDSLAGGAAGSGGHPSPRSVLAGGYRLANDYGALNGYNTPGRSVGVGSGARRPRASSAGSVARSSPLLKSLDVISSREAAQQIFNRAELLLQIPELAGQEALAGTGPETGGAGNASVPATAAAAAPALSALASEGMSLADQLLLVGEALAREREIASKATGATTTVTPIRPSGVVKPVSSEPRLSSALTSSSSVTATKRVVKASPSNDTLPSVQISESDSPSPRHATTPAGVGQPTSLPPERSRSASPVPLPSTASIDFWGDPALQTPSRQGSQGTNSNTTSDIAQTASPSTRTRDDDRWLDRFRRVSGDSSTFQSSKAWIARTRPSFSSNRSPENSAPNSVRSKLHGNSLLPALPPTTRTRSKSTPGQPKPMLRQATVPNTPLIGGSGSASSEIGRTAGTGPQNMLSPPPRTPNLRRLRTTSDADLSLNHPSGGVGASPVQPGAQTPGNGSGKRKDSLFGHAAASLKDLILLNKEWASSKLSLGSSTRGSTSDTVSPITVEGASSESSSRSQSVSGAPSLMSFGSSFGPSFRTRTPQSPDRRSGSRSMSNALPPSSATNPASSSHLTPHLNQASFQLASPLALPGSTTEQGDQVSPSTSASQTRLLSLGTINSAASSARPRLSADLIRVKSREQIAMEQHLARREAPTWQHPIITEGRASIDSAFRPPLALMGVSNDTQPSSTSHPSSQSPRSLSRAASRSRAGSSASRVGGASTPSSASGGGDRPSHPVWSSSSTYSADVGTGYRMQSPAIPERTATSTHTSSATASASSGFNSSFLPPHTPVLGTEGAEGIKARHTYSPSLPNRLDEYAARVANLELALQPALDSASALPSSEAPGSSQQPTSGLGLSGTSIGSGGGRGGGSSGGGGGGSSPGSSTLRQSTSSATDTRTLRGAETEWSAGIALSPAVGPGFDASAGADVPMPVSSGGGSGDNRGPSSSTSSPPPADGPSSSPSPSSSNTVAAAGTPPPITRKSKMRLFRSRDASAS